jgi:hypothetical protein
LIAVQFEEGNDTRLKDIQKYNILFSSELLLAEVHAFSARKNLDVALAREAVRFITWIMPERSLQPEIERVRAAGYLRGADLWHLACACYLSPGQDLDFLTRDVRQRDAASLLGFTTPEYA